MRLLLLNPKFPESFWSFRWAVVMLHDSGRREFERLSRTLAR